MRIFKDFTIDSNIVKEFKNYQYYSLKNHDYEISINPNDVEDKSNTNSLTKNIDNILTMKSVDDVISIEINLNNDKYSVSLFLNEKEITKSLYVNKASDLFKSYYLHVKHSIEDLSEDAIDILNDYLP